MLVLAILAAVLILVPTVIVATMVWAAYSVARNDGDGRLRAIGWAINTVGLYLGQLGSEA